MKIDTLCVQGGWYPKCGEPRQVPVYSSTTFKYDTTQHMADLFDLKAPGYFYTRLANPTNDAVAKKIAALEGGVAAILTSSGQAASTFAILNLCNAGDHVVSSAQIYGGTFNLFAVSLKKLGIEFTFVDPDATPAEIQKAFRPNTKCVFGETVANPSGCVLDIAKFAKVAHKTGVPLIVDNTFPTPILCRPFEFGCDIVTHATTKYMDGHSSQVGGCIVDSGNFDWSKHADKFPGLVEPDASYHGLSYVKAFGKMAYIVKCTGCVKDDEGRVVEIHAEYDPTSKSGMEGANRKVKGTLHWVSAQHAIDAEVRMFDRLFATEAPDEAPEGKTFLDNLNPNSLQVLQGCKLEPALAEAHMVVNEKGIEEPMRYQFERMGYFCTDRDGTPGHPVFNRSCSLKDTWAKISQS